MEAPEKIYIFENPITGTPDDRWLSKRSDDEDIEYTRTDAFKEKIEKLRSLGWGMYYAYRDLTNDASQIRKAMKEWWNFINHELNKGE